MVSIVLDFFCLLSFFFYRGRVALASGDTRGQRTESIGLLYLTPKKGDERREECPGRGNFLGGPSSYLRYI